MILMEIIFISILGFAIGCASNVPNNDEPIHIQLLGIIVACIISYPIMMAFCILMEIT